MWGVYTVDSDLRRSSSYHDPLRSSSLENIRTHCTSPKRRENDSIRIEFCNDHSQFCEEIPLRRDNSPRKVTYADRYGKRKQFKLDNNLDDNSDSGGRHCSRSSTISTTASRFGSDRRLIKNFNRHSNQRLRGHHLHRERRRNLRANMNKNDPEMIAAAIREKKRRRIVFVIVLVAASLLLMSILLMVITVQLTPSDTDEGEYGLNIFIILQVCVCECIRSFYLSFDFS